MQLEETLNNKINSDYWEKKLNEDMADAVVSTFALSLSKRPEQKDEYKLTVDLPDPLTAQIARICNDSEVLIFTFHLTALSSLIFKYTKTEKLFFGSAYLPAFEFEKRGAVGNDHLIFYKAEIEKHLSFKQLFSKLKEEVLDTANYHGILMSDVRDTVAEGNIESLLQFGFMMEDIDDESPLLNSFELLFIISNTSNGGQLAAFFDANKSDRQLIQFFLANYCTFLQNILQNLYTPIIDLEFISAGEKQLLLHDFSGPERALTFPTAVDRFEYNATQVPNRIAIEFNDKNISYTELNNGANQLGRILLTKASLKADDLVAIIMDRSEKMAEAILAVWKCGAAYVPIDPEYPIDRIKTILENAAVTLIIIEREVLHGTFNEMLVSFATVISLDEVEKEKQQLEKSNLTITVDPNALAYVIYTSGSTGQPKGVMIEHIGMMNHLEAKLAEMEIGAESIVVQNAPQCFDISVWQLFAALMAGGKTIIYDNEVVLNLEEFINRVDQDGVTTLELVPSYLLEMQYLLDEMKDKELFSKLNILILNAETLMPATVQRWFGAFPLIRIVNTYGATEVSDDMSHYIMDKLPVTATVPVMYRPIQNFKLYILDDAMQLCPIGVNGEIYLSGFAVGRGYLNDEEKTRAAFVSDPFVKGKKSRMYKTGDIGRLLPDGTMEFYGRQDFQVKIRGHRVEPGEIEHQLTKLEGIKNAVVLDRESEDNQKYLVAYIIAEDKIDAAAIAAKLREQLPDYMVPAFFVQLESFPLTPNGKINKKNLPDPGNATQNSYSASTAFARKIEEKLIRIWQEVLDKKKIGTK
ncbi:MAG: amino acid adenylation domain-containing protein, partial [Chitinophagaceae bacterium]